MRKGDRVIVTRRNDAASVGMIGTIVTIRGSSLGIKFDKKFTGGHSLNGFLEGNDDMGEGYGQWVHKDSVRYVDKVQIEW